MKLRVSFWLSVLASMTVFALPVAAAGDDPVFTPLGTLFRWINSAIVIGAVVWLVRRYGPAAFRRRRETILAAITEAGRTKEDADRRLREAEQRLANLDQEIAALRDAALREREAEARRLRDATAAEIAKIERVLQAEIAAAERAARMELKAQAARLAVEQAESLVRQQLTPAARTGLFRAFVENLGRSAN